MDAILFGKVCFCKIEFGSNLKFKTFLTSTYILHNVIACGINMFMSFK